jgi:hypothetical protein
MKAVLLTLCLSLAAIEAHAISRYNSTSMTCDEVKAAVGAEGEAILRWRSTTVPGLQRYGRFVSSQEFCRMSERAETSYIPTADRKSCALSECKPYTPEDDFIFRRRR